VLRNAVLAFDDRAGEMRLYLDGVEAGRAAASYRLSDLVDENNWLGRSQWGQDFNLPGVYSSFEVYDVALSPEEVFRVFSAGPL
jgi:hypothetical protein